MHGVSSQATNSRAYACTVSCALQHAPHWLLNRVQVFDGHCGSHAAEFASSRILEGVTGHTHFPGDIPASLVRAVVL